MTTTTFPTDLVLRSGRIAHVDADRRATLAICPWFVQVPSNHPEPDSEADCWVTRDCGAPLFAIDGDIDAGWHCSNGHHHFAYGSARQQAEERAEAEVEYRASLDPNLARRLDDGERWEDIAGFDAEEYFERQAEARQEARYYARDEAREWGGIDA